MSEEDEKPPPLEGELVPARQQRQNGGRSKGYTHAKRTIDRIKSTRIVQLLHEHIEGRYPMTQSQVNAARILLAKTIPDLRSTEHTGHVVHRHVTQMTDAELEAIIANGRSSGALEAQVSALEPAPVH